MHHNHARNALQTAFDRDALIVRAFEQLIERRGDFLHVVDRLVLHGLGRERIPVEGEHRVVRVACRRCRERMLLSVIHLGYQHVLCRFAQNVFFPNAFHFHVHRHARRDFGDTVVQERHAPFDGVSHPSDRRDSSG